MHDELQDAEPSNENRPGKHEVQDVVPEVEKVLAAHAVQTPKFPEL